MRNIIVLSVLLTMSMCLSCRSELGLALGGGGAKAAAEVGALISLDKSEAKVGYIAGASMGAVVGGLYAAGYSGEEIREMWLDEDWLSLFEKDAIGILKEGDDNEVERTIFGLIDGKEFENRLRDALNAKMGGHNFEDTKIPFSCTATEIIDDTSLKPVVLDSGDMAKAIHASMCYPAPLVGFTAVDFDGKQLVDGGMMNNLPVDVVRKMGAEKVIAIDLEMKQNHDKSLFEKVLGFIVFKSLRLSRVLQFTNTEWLANWLDDHSETIEKHEQNRKDADVLIWPDLRRYNIMSFDKDDVEYMIDIGRDVMKGQLYKVADLLYE